MKKSALVALGVLVLGLLLMVAAKFLLPIWQEMEQKKNSDAGLVAGKIRVGVDSWVGYVPLCSKDMKNRMLTSGYLLSCEDDQADYANRFRKLSKGELEFAVATVDSYLVGGASYDYPGTIIAVIDESKGGDGIVARKRDVANLDALKKLTKATVAYTPASPSEFLLKATMSHFDIKGLRKKGGLSHLETDGAEAAYDALLSNKAQVAVLWEPYLTKALSRKEMTSLLSSKDTAKLIVDVLVVSREFAKKSPEVVKSLLSHYFRTLKYYRQNQDKLIAEIKSKTSLPTAQVKAMLGGVQFVHLHSNALDWFGVGAPGQEAGHDLFASLEAAMDILRTAGDFESFPFPGDNPLALLNRRFVDDLFKNGVMINPSKSSAKKIAFAPLDDQAWLSLVEVGTLKVEPITFQSGTSKLSELGESQVKKAAQHLSHYPHFRVLVKGHTGLGGDQNANKVLSLERAQAVREVMVKAIAIDPHRIKAFGYGSAAPLERLPGESERAYKYRLPRVELLLVSDVL